MSTVKLSIYVGNGQNFRSRIRSRLELIYCCFFQVRDNFSESN